MTRQLKELMHEATDRPAFVPDVDQLLTTGRRQTRKRQVLTSIVVAAAVVLTAGGITIAATTNGSAPAPAATPPEPADPFSMCETDKVAPDRPPTSTDPANWSELVVSTDDADGTSSVRVSPTTGKVAYCSTWLGIRGTVRPPRPTGYYNGALGRINMVHKFETTGCGGAAREDCDGTSISFAGRLPTGVTRVSLVGTGQTVEAVLGKGFYVGRFFAPLSAGRYVPIMVEMYVASGKLLVEATG